MRVALVFAAILIAATGFAPAAAALILSVQPHAQVASIGNVVDVVIDYNDQGNPTLGGGFSIAFDATALEPVAYDYGLLGDPRFDAIPRKGSGWLNDFAINLFGALSDGRISTVSFRVLREGVHTVTLPPSARLGTLWASAVDFGTFYAPQFQNGVLATDVAPITVLWVANLVTSDIV